MNGKHYFSDAYRAQLSQNQAPAPQASTSLLRSFPARLAAILCLLTAALSIIRPVQRAIWLVYDFQPSGMLWENVLLGIQEGWIALNSLLWILTAIAACRFCLLRKPSGGKLLRAVCGIRSFFCILGILLTALVTAGIAGFCIHYRMSATVIGSCILFGVIIIVLLGFVWRFQRNLMRILSDLIRVMIRKAPDNKHSVRCRLTLQALVTTVIVLLPCLLTFYSVTILEQSVNALSSSIPGISLIPLKQLVGNGVTSIGSMYTLEYAISLCTGSICLLTIPLYHLYRGIHAYKKHK